MTGLFAIILSGFFEGNIRLVWKTIGGYFSACFLLPVLFGQFFPKKLSDNQFVGVCFAGLIGTTTWYLIEKSGWWMNVEAFYIGLFSTFSAIVLCLLTNRAKQKNLHGSANT